MNNLEFSVPFNCDPDMLSDVFHLVRSSKNKVREIYLAGPREYSGSGRETNKLDTSQFISIVDQIHREGIRVNLVLNPTCEGVEWYRPAVVEKKMEYLRQMHEDHGVEAVTLANPIYIMAIRNLFPNIEICASVLSDIDSVQKAVFYSKAGADVISPDVNINRNLNLLKEIKEATNTKLKLLVNEGCLYKCPFRKFHFNYLSHKSKMETSMTETGDSIFFKHCRLITYNDPSQILKSGWIRPEDTRKYNEISCFFKIVGRMMPTSRVIRTTKAYLEESWDGNILDIMDGNLRAFCLEIFAYLDNKSLDKFNFFEKITSCYYNCDKNKCSYCEMLLKKLIFGPRKGA